MRVGSDLLFSIETDRNQSVSGAVEYCAVRVQLRRYCEESTSHAAVIPVVPRSESPSIPSTKPLILTHVTVIDVTGSPAKPDMSVVIRNHRIAAIGRTIAVVPPKDSEIVDATGKFLIPGLWDMHVHTGRKDIFLPLYIANGVTGVRDMGGDIEDPSGELSSLSGRYIQLSLWRAAIEEGSLLGPRLVIAGFLIDGFKWPGNIAATNAEEGRQAVDVLKKTGVDFVKVKSFLSKDTFLAIAAEARRQHMVLAGHARMLCELLKLPTLAKRASSTLPGLR